MLSCFTVVTDKPVIPIFPILEKEFDQHFSKESEKNQRWITNNQFYAKPGSICVISDSKGDIEKVWLGVADYLDWSLFGQTALQLPQGIYTLQIPSQLDLYLPALAWGLSSYQFNRYKKIPALETKLFLTQEIPYLNAILRATYLVRDLINMPASDMMPCDLVNITQDLAEEFNAQLTVLMGESLLRAGYNAIYSVGQASQHAPQLLDLRWGNTSFPKVTLVGKGVCFDSGGLNLKPTAGMANMKKDMAGAAHVLGLATFIMSLKLPICLRILIPAVENAVSGYAYRPGDIIKTRKGLTVEVTNTDAEGRLILSEALDEAAKEEPELLVDLATLTGAARVALGTEIGALFTPNDNLATQLIACGQQENDPLWRLPLYPPYRKLIESKVADLVNSTNSPYAGALTAALFLKEFVPSSINWVHLDIMAWNINNKPSAPEGGEANALRAIARYLYQRFTPNQS